MFGPSACALGTEFKNAVGVVPVVVQRLALVGEHRRAVGGQRGGGVVLGGEDVARSPAHIGAQGLQGFDQHGGLDGHVQRTGDARAFQRLASANSSRIAIRPGISVSAMVSSFAAPIGQAQVGDFVVFKLATTALAAETA